jgi:SAM-dependent methyltransferase
MTAGEDERGLIEARDHDQQAAWSPAGDDTTVPERASTRVQPHFTASIYAPAMRPGTVTVDVLAFVRASLPDPPARVLEIGAGSGELAAALRELGHEVTAIDPQAETDGVEPVALLDLPAPDEPFDAAVAIVSLHHVTPLGRSLRHLAGLLRRGALLVVDEFDGWAYDEAAAAWWLSHSGVERAPGDLIADLREHVHPLGAIREALTSWFDIGVPVPGAYLYRWKLDPVLRAEEEALIAAGKLPATGARFVAVRR